MPNLDLFLDKHQEEARKELDCYNDLMQGAIKNMLHADFGKAARYHENIAESLYELQKLKNEKLAYDQAVELIQKAGLRAFKEVMQD